MSEKREGNLFYDKEVTFMISDLEMESYYGGLHCGECFEVKINDVWVPVRIEMDEDGIWWDCR